MSVLQDAPGTPSQLLPCCSRLIEIFPWPDPSTEQNGIYSQSKANQRKRTKVYRPPELLWNEEVSDVWVNSIPLLYSPRCRLPGERLVLMKSFNPLTYERTGFRFRCIYLKTSDPNKVISLSLPALYQDQWRCVLHLWGVLGNHNVPGKQRLSRMTSSNADVRLL